MATTISSGRGNSPLLTANIADHGTIYGGRGLIFDGVTDYLTGTIGEEYSSLENFSLSVWTTVDTASDWRRVFIANSTSASVRFGIKSTGKMTFMPNSATGDINFTGTALSTTGGWYHHVVTFDKATTTVKHYLNGALDYTKTDCTDTALDVAGTYVVGSYNGVSLHWDGKISDLKLFDATLTEAQAQELYLKPEQSAPSAVRDNIFLWLPMCEGNPDSPQSVVYDHSEKKLGSELLADPTFDDDTTVSVSGTHWSISNGTIAEGEEFYIGGGKLVAIGAQDARLTDYSVLTSGRFYKFQITLDSVGDSGRLRGAGNNKMKDISNIETTGVGTYTRYFVADGTVFSMDADATADFTATDISVKEVLMGNHATTVFYGDDLTSGHGAFDVTTNWSVVSGSLETEWSIGSSKATHATGNTNTLRYENAGTPSISGRQYQIDFTISGRTAGNIEFAIGGGSASESDFTASDSTTLTSGGSTSRIVDINPTSDFDGSVELITIKEVGVSSTGFATAQEEPTIPQVPLMRYNEKMVFDGVDDYVDIPNIPSSSVYTVSSWVNINDYASNSDFTIFGFASDNTDVNILYYFGSDGNKLGLNVFNGDSYGISGFDKHNQWVHMVAIFHNSDFESFELYINGVSQTVTQTKGTTLNRTLSQSFGIGYTGYYTTNQLLYGSINEVSVFNSALSLTEVQELFADGVALDATTHSKADDNLVGYWRNDGVSSWTDRSDIQAISFDGTDDYISRADILGATYTICGWVNFDSIDDSSWEHLFGEVYAGLLAKASSFSFYYRNDSPYTLTGSWSISSGSWVHLAVTNSSTTKSVFLNGVREGTVSDSSSYNATGDFQIGRSITGEFVDGLMSQVAVWSSALTDAQITEIYNLGRRDTDLTTSYSTNMVAYYLLNPSHSSPDITGSDGIEDRSGNDNHATQSGTVGFLGANDGTPAGTPESIIVREGLNSNKDGLGFPFKNDDRDVLRLDGVKDFVKIEYPAMSDQITSGIYTFDFWVKHNRENTGVTETYICLRDNNATGNRFKIQKISVADNASYPIIRFTVEGGATITYNSSHIDTLDEGGWFYIALVSSGVSSRQFYYAKSGADSLTAVTANTTTYANTNVWDEIQIGQKQEGDGALGLEMLDGVIDEVRYYSKALSATELLKNYKHGKGKHKN